MRHTVSAVVLLGLGVLLSCGGGSSTTPPPPSKTQQAYLPLAIGNTWAYDCGGGISITDTVTQSVTVGGQQTFAMQLQFPSGPTQTFLLANDAQGNTTLYGFLVNGATTMITPAPYIASNPTTGQMFNYHDSSGATVNRIFFNFESTNPTPLGIFQVASYNDNGTQDIWGYTLGKGITEQDHGSFDCKVTSIQVH